MSGALPSARAASLRPQPAMRSSQSGIANADPWGSLYGRSPESLTAGDRNYYDHHESGSKKLADAVRRYQAGWR